MDEYIQTLLDYQIFSNCVRFPKISLGGFNIEDDDKDTTRFPVFNLLNEHAEKIYRHIHPGNVTFVSGKGMRFAVNSQQSFAYFLGRSTNPRLFYTLVDNYNVPGLFPISMILVDAEISYGISHRRLCVRLANMPYMPIAIFYSTDLAKFGFKKYPNMEDAPLISVCGDWEEDECLTKKHRPLEFR